MSESESESDRTTQKKFADYPLADDVQEGIRRMGFETPTPIQELCIPPVLEGRDVVGKAETGTGKTIGFAAPLIGKLDTQRVATQALVLTPTRELAKQVAEVVEELGKGRGLGVAMVVGGVHAAEQLMKLRSGSQVVVGTPGRVLDFLRERHLSLAWCETVVLDEADRMLDMGFIDDVTEILNKTPEDRQTLLFSATIPPEIQKLLSRYMKDPLIVSTSKGRSAASEIQQQYVEAPPHRKFRELCRILDKYPEGPVIVFCNTRRRTIDVDRMLWGHGYSAGALHGDQEQEVRFKVLESFRQGQVKCLVCTDVASRGLDIEKVSCVVNYEIPEDEDSYVHRIGRTGRAQKTGVSISIVAPQERGIWQRIQRAMGGKIERLGGPRSESPRDEDEAPRRGRGRFRRREDGRDRAGETAATGGVAASAAADSGEARAGSSRRRRGRRRSRRDEDRVRSGETRENGRATAPAASSLPPNEELDAEGKPTLTYTSPRLAEKSAARKQLKRLDEIDDDFVKTEYFDIDPSVIARVAPSVPPSREGRDSEGSRHRRGGGGGGGGGDGGRSSRGRGRGGRGRGSRRGGGRSGEGGAAPAEGRNSPAEGRSSSPAEGRSSSPAEGRSSSPAGADAGEGSREAGAGGGEARRTRSRRRRRRRSGSGSGSGSGAPKEQG